ncbi:MAG: DNA polymerase III subunit [Pseudomonadota bacterium]
MDPASPSRPTVQPGTGDILGQERACRQLWTSLAADRLHHCYLFEGPPGVGKATVALRLAMAANCEGRPGEGAPCARCPACQAIAAGRHPDVIELAPDPGQASGTITIEQARELLRRLSLHRHSARRRFVIVDPVDLVRTEAVNALLKTLEEPPEATGFILVTARTASLLPTVISRSLRVRFSAVEDGTLAAWLEARGIVEPARLARLSLGSPGRALELAQGRLAALEEARAALLEAIEAGPTPLLSYIEALSASPRSAWEPKIGLCLDALELLLRDATCCATGRGEEVLDPAQRGLAERWGERLWPGGLRRVDDAMEQARASLLLNVTPRLVMEALLTTLAVELG